MVQRLPLGDYDIFLSQEVQSLADVFDFSAYSGVVIFTDENTRQYCLPEFLAVFPSLTGAPVLEIAAGEGQKNVNTCQELWSRMQELKVDRNTLMLNLGGGVVGDMGGFVAATYKRGIDFVNVPTTLLAQVDATVGGKTGINFGYAKNGVGLFTNPKAVLISTDFLKTLPEDHLYSGYAEILKYALIADRALWKELLLCPPEQLINRPGIIERSLQVKRDVVDKDPFEKGLRKVLNFGHTIGHALESYTLHHSERPLLHGQAVAFGMLAEVWLSHKKYGWEEADLMEVSDYISALYNNVWQKDLSTEKIVELTAYDKKNTGENINFTLLKEIGQPEIDVILSKEDIAAAVEFVKSRHEVQS